MNITEPTEEEKDVAKQCMVRLYRKHRVMVKKLAEKKKISESEVMRIALERLFESDM